MSRGFERTGGSLAARRDILLAAVLSLFGSAACGMSNVRWKDRRRVPGWVAKGRIPLVVDASERARAADPGGAIDTMVLVVQADLLEEGVEAEILSPKPSRMPLPRVEIVVRTWDEGDYAASYVTNYVAHVPVAGNAKILVTCQAVSSDNRVTFSGTVTSYQPGTSNFRDLAEDTGHAIADALTDPTWR